MKNLIQISLFIFVIFAFFVGCNEDNVVNNDNDNKILVTQKVNVENQDATVVLPNEVEVFIPQGAFTGDATISIKSVDLKSFPAHNEFEMIQAYEVTSTSGSKFAKDLQIKIKPKPEMPKLLSAKNGAAYLHEKTNKLIPFLDYNIDTSGNEIVIRTNHLTELGIFSYYGLQGYTHTSKSTHFEIYWTEPGVLANQEYNSPYSMTNNNIDPHYIQDILFYLEKSWTAYKNADLYLPTSRIKVFVQELEKGTDGQASFLGHIYINQRIDDSDYASTEETLPSVCAHELLHFVQDYYYMQLFSEKTIQWWLEATAVTADKFVFPNNKKFEVIEYAGNIDLNLAKPWDDCNSDPHFYIAGTFMSYLIYHREGTKLSLPRVIKEGGNETNVSYMRTFLDNLIKNDLGSNGIGEEFKNFVKWAYERKGEIKIPVTRPTPTPKFINYKSAILKTKFDSYELFLPIPRLSASFFKGLNAQGETQQMTVKLNSKSSMVDAFVYKVNDKDEVIFIKQINQDDSVKVELSDTKEWAEVVCINKSKDEDGSAKVTFSFNNLPYINSILPSKAKIGDEIEINGSKFGSKNSTSEIYFNSLKVNLEKYLKTWNENQIVLVVPEGSSSGDVYIKTENISSNKKDFEVLKSAPIIDSVLMKVNKAGSVDIYKPWGFSKINSRIRIFGKNWVKDASKTFVRINNNQDAKIITLQDSYIEFEVPSLKGNIQVSVKSEGIESENKNFFVGMPVEALKELNFLEFSTKYWLRYTDSEDNNKEKTNLYSITISKDYIESASWNGNILTLKSKVYIQSEDFYQTTTVVVTVGDDGTFIEKLDFSITALWGEVQYSIKNLTTEFVQSGYQYRFTRTKMIQEDYSNVVGKMKDTRYKFLGIANAPSSSENRLDITYEWFFK